MLPNVEANELINELVSQMWSSLESEYLEDWLIISLATHRAIWARRMVPACAGPLDSFHHRRPRATSDTAADPRQSSEPRQGQAVRLVSEEVSSACGGLQSSPDPWQASARSPMGSRDGPQEHKLPPQLLCAVRHFQRIRRLFR